MGALHMGVGSEHVGAWREHMGALHMSAYGLHVAVGSSGDDVYLVYLKCMAHGCMKGAHECITHGCVAWAWVARSLPGVPEVVPGGCTEG